MKNEEEYYKVDIPQKKHFKEEPFITWRNWWKILLILLGTAAFSLMLPFSSRRVFQDYPLTETEHRQRLTASMVIFGFFLIMFIWILFVSPKFKKKQEYELYFLAGQFYIIDKKIVSGKCILQLQPGADHEIEVDNEIFESISVGDKIFVERTIKGIVRKLIKI